MDYFQYSLLQTASETCQKKRHCKFTASARAFGGDPCPGVKKFVEVAFKCRPCKYTNQPTPHRRIRTSTRYASSSARTDGLIFHEGQCFFCFLISVGGNNLQSCWPGSQGWCSLPVCGLICMNTEWAKL